MAFGPALLHDGVMQEDRLSTIPDMTDQDIVLVVAALADTNRRIQKVALSRRTVWIKRYGTEKALVWRRLYAPLSPLMPPAFRVSPILDAPSMINREIARMERFRGNGIDVPHVLYRSGSALVLSDTGPSVHWHLAVLYDDPDRHDDFLVYCAACLGRLHAAGLCHGRPYPRDMTITEGRIGFLDFEEDAEAVMPLATAQARDIWLFFFQLVRRARQGEETLSRALAAWRGEAPPQAWDALGQIIAVAARFLPLARLIGRVRMGSDLRRFIMATGYLEKATEPGAPATGEAGK